jgi:hypothetical protein
VNLVPMVSESIAANRVAWVVTVCRRDLTEARRVARTLAGT